MVSVINSTQTHMLQLTLAVIKPDAVAHPLMLEALHQRILDNNFVIVRCKDLVWRRQDSERFYAEHSGGNRTDFCSVVLK
uniref:Nucleoside diphosphate kinase B n=1 Tax=Lates calcarifer TaxID=8187 RepID=A0A4W6F1Q5_LATCA